ncbi:hypothetical protein ACIRRH_31010 [Kitasatospora sp. NPDC101235]|uniref:hypothetical protein n=1 Tax=Kitasatospora sp. NPDC101235 TaxID=3364101 RepID=UPI0038308F6E
MTAAGATSQGAAPTITPTLQTSGAPALGPPIPAGAALRNLLPTATTLPAGWRIGGDGKHDTGTYVSDDPGRADTAQEPCTQMRLVRRLITHLTRPVRRSTAHVLHWSHRRRRRRHRARTSHDKRRGHSPGAEASSP